MASRITLSLDLHPPQRAALYSPAEQTLYGGAAGGGKSYLLRAAAITWCLAVPGLSFYLFRRTYGDLIANHFEGYQNFHEMLAPLVASGQCRILQKSIKFSNGSKIVLCYLNNIADLSKYQGRQIHALGIDEATHFNEREIRFLFSRMRLGGLKLPEDCQWSFPRAILCTNPGGIGHLWAKKWFVDHGAFKVFRSNRKNGNKLRTFIPAKLSDNPTMTETDPEYANSLRGLGDPLLVRAMLEGDWKIAAGAMYGAVWRDSLHTCDCFGIPPDWEIWRGADDGFASPAAVYWLTEDPRDKTIYVIDELYRAKMYPDTMAAEIKARDKGIILWDQEEGTPFLNPNADYTGLLDSAAFSDSGQQGSIARGLQLRKMGVRFMPTKKWTGSRIHRAQNLHRLLAVNKKTGKPGIIFFKKCVHAIETIPVLPRDKNNPEDVDTNGDDHAYDAVTYGLQWKNSNFKKMPFKT